VRADGGRNVLNADIRKNLKKIKLNLGKNTIQVRYEYMKFNTKYMLALLKNTRNKHNFIKHKSRYRINEDYLRINKSNINLSKVAYEKIGEPERVDIHYDKKNKQIKVLKGVETKVSHKRVIGSTVFGRIMPIGRYDFIGDNIYKLD